jgi:pyrroline-5-carboxylate reductase
MVVGLIGSGNMARALARGWGEPVLCTDGGSGRARELAAELGGEAVASNAELVQRADVVVLCHKPYQLDAVAQDAGRSAKAIASVLGATTISDLQAAWPQTPVIRTLPNTPVEVGQGVTCFCAAPDIDPEVERSVHDLFARVGAVFVLEEARMDIATAVMGVTPAYLSLVTEANVDAAVKYGLPAPLAAELFVKTLAGTAALLEAKGFDTLEVRRQVTSPGGSTARGLAALEAAGLRAAFLEAMAAVAGKS